MKSVSYILMFSALVFFVQAAYSLDNPPSPFVEQLKESYKRPLNIPFPADNPYSAEKALLGKMLFFDQRLSKHSNLNCASCHNPSLGWEDSIPVPFGNDGRVTRHSPTLLNLAWSEKFFWDGRADSLENQAKGPIQDEKEMNLPLETAVERLKNIDGYRQIFSRVFNDGITPDNIVKAIATFERTLVSGTAPFDRWVNGEEDAISHDAKEGFVLFNTKAGCSNCHGGWNFTDRKFHDIGLNSPDEGRHKISSQAPLHSFKTPTLRNISQRAPYMHNGTMAGLDDVMAHYITGGIERPGRSSHITPISLNSTEVQQVIEFMEALTGEDKPISLPLLPY